MSEILNDGSFYFPNPFKNVDEMIDFWTNIPIPDSALGSLREAYASRLDYIESDYVRKNVIRPMDDWEKIHPKPTGNTIIAWYTERKKIQKGYERDILQWHRDETPDLPKFIPIEDARASARAYRMYYFTLSIWTEEEKEKADSFTFTTSRGILSVGELVKTYRLNKLGNLFEEPETAKIKILETQIKKLEELVYGIGDVRDEVKANTDQIVDSSEYLSGKNLFE